MLLTVVMLAGAAGPVGAEAALGVDSVRAVTELGWWGQRSWCGPGVCRDVDASLTPADFTVRDTTFNPYFDQGHFADPGFDRTESDRCFHGGRSSTAAERGAPRWARQIPRGHGGAQFHRGHEDFPQRRDDGQPRSTHGGLHQHRHLLRQRCAACQGKHRKTDLDRSACGEPHHRPFRSRGVREPHSWPAAQLSLPPTCQLRPGETLSARGIL